MDEPLPIRALQALLEKAGQEILRVRRSPLTVSHKADRSLLTEADTRAHHMLLDGLRALTPDIDVISEEGDLPAALPARAWLVDPLDGTQAFVRGGDDFSINLGMVEHGAAMFGMIYHPPSGDVFVGGTGVAPYVVRSGIQHLLPRAQPSGKVRKIVKSASTPSAHMRAHLQRFPEAEILGMSSALKFCYLAEGRADHYPRFGHTMEWDTAAGQAILEATGGCVLGLDGQTLAYGKPDFRNHGFMAWRNIEIANTQENH